MRIYEGGTLRIGQARFAGLSVAALVAILENVCGSMVAAKPENRRLMNYYREASEYSLSTHQVKVQWMLAPRRSSIACGAQRTVEVKI